MNIRISTYIYTFHIVTCHELVFIIYIIINYFIQPHISQDEINIKMRHEQCNADKLLVHYEVNDKQFTITEYSSSVLPQVYELYNEYSVVG